MSVTPTTVTLIHIGYTNDGYINPHRLPEVAASRTVFEVLGLGLGFGESSPWPRTSRSSKIGLSSVEDSRGILTAEQMGRNIAIVQRN